jgi:signal transduction histidine kinase
VAFHTIGITRYPGEVESAVYYSCLEAIQNATKHGGPNVRISVTLLDDANELSFEVVDHGTGFDPADAHGGTGLQNIRDRVGAIDGRVSITATVGHGTVVAGSIPLAGGTTEAPRQYLTPPPTHTESIPRSARH